MYLVTGCINFIGFHMCELLLNNRIKVIRIDFLNKYYSKDLKLKRLSILNKKILINSSLRIKSEIKITHGSNNNLPSFIDFEKLTSFKNSSRETTNWYSNFKYKKFLEIDK